MFLFFFVFSILSAQTTINGGRTTLGPVDNSGASTTKPSKAGTSLPGTCSVGETYIKTDATASQQFYVCSSTNTWTAQGGGSSGLTSNAGDSLFFPWGEFSFHASRALTAAVLYLDAFVMPTQMQFRNCRITMGTAAAAGKYAMCAIYTRASSGDLTLRAKTSPVAVDVANQFREFAWSSGDYVSGGVLTLPAAQNYYIGFGSDGAPTVHQTYDTTTPRWMRNGWNGSSFTKKGMATVTGGVTGSGASIDVPASISDASVLNTVDRGVMSITLVP